MIRLALLIAATLFASPAFACALPDGVADVKRAIATEWNAERNAGRLGALARERTLEDAAQSHACDMAEKKAMSHIGSDGDDLRARLASARYNYRFANENIGNFSNPDGAVKWWMGSSGHRNNILARGVVEFGIGVALGQDGRTYMAVISGARR